MKTRHWKHVIERLQATRCEDASLEACHREVCKLHGVKTRHWRHVIERLQATRCEDASLEACHREVAGYTV